MRKVLLATVAVVAALNVAGGAYAADMQLKAAPAPVLEAAPSWSGAYLGARGGWGWGTADYLNLGGSSTGGTFGGVTVPFSTSFGARGSTQSHDVDGGILGYVTGMNWQTGSWVFGIEQTTSWSGIKGSTGNVNFPVPPATTVPTGTFGSKLKWYATADSRLGYAFGQSLLYVKGGFAFGRVDVTGLRTNGAGNGDNFRFKDDRIGWTAGAGWDYMLSRNWVIGIEGNYLDLGKSTVAGQTIDVNGNPGAGSFNEEVKFKFWSVLGRVAYKW